MIKLYFLFHKNSVKKEIELADLSDSDKILHIGCGAIPYTALIISDEVNEEVIGIDKDEQVISRAKNVIRKNFKNYNVKLKVGNGEKYDVSLFNIIIISYGVSNPEEVLRHVLKTMKGPGKIIFRDNYFYNNNIKTILKDYIHIKKRLLITQESIILIIEN